MVSATSSINCSDCTVNGRNSTECIAAEYEFGINAPAVFLCDHDKKVKSFIINGTFSAILSESNDQGLKSTILIHGTLESTYLNEKEVVIYAEQGSQCKRVEEGPKSEIVGTIDSSHLTSTVRYKQDMENPLDPICIVLRCFNKQKMCKINVEQIVFALIEDSIEQKEEAEEKKEVEIAEKLDVKKALSKVLKEKEKNGDLKMNDTENEVGKELRTDARASSGSLIFGQSYIALFVAMIIGTITIMVSIYVYDAY